LTLDQFLPPTPAKQKDTGIDVVEEKCSNPKSHKKLSYKEPTYKITIDGDEKTYCQACAKKIMKPQEDAEVI